MNLNSLLGRLRRKPAAEPESFPVGHRRVEFVSNDHELDRVIAQNNVLLRYAKAGTSQDGEEGVLQHVLETIGVTQGWCVEFGAWDGQHHANTWDLVHNSGWHAVYFEPSGPAFARLQDYYRDRQDVHCFNTFVGFEGDNTLDEQLAKTPIPTEFELLVIDVDGDDWHIWEAFTRYRAKVVMIEFSAFCPPDVRFVKPKGAPGLASASLRSVCELGRDKGYELVCVVGGNAVMVSREYFQLFAIPDNRPEAMFRSYAYTRLFQGYDGTLHLAGKHALIWRHQKDESGDIKRVQISDEDIQVLPRGLRVFRPRLTYDNPLLAEHAGKIDRSRVPSNRLLAFQHNRTSECGEDGILAQIFKTIGEGGRYCVDVGANDGIAFSSTRTLLEEHGWHGILIEKDVSAFSSLQSIYAGRSGVTTIWAEVASHGERSLEAILSRDGAPRDPDLLCIDIEGNDYHIWASTRHRRSPRVVVIDFNPTVPNDVLFVQQDDATVHDGASLRALIELGQILGYELAAVTTWNAIFVRQDIFPQLGVAQNDIDRMYYPIFETRAFWSINSYLTISGCDRLVRHNYPIDPERIQPVPPDIRNRPFKDGLDGPFLSTFF
jgi:hypothetical protein